MPTPIYEVVLGAVTGIFKPAVDKLDELHLSKEEKAAFQNIIDKATLEVAGQQFAAEAKRAEAESAAIVALAAVAEAEAKGDSWLQRNWRPILMTVITSMLTNNFILLPYLSAMVPAIKATPIPAACWVMLGAATGTYTIGRTLEKKEKIKSTFVKLAGSLGIKTS